MATDKDFRIKNGLVVEGTGDSSIAGDVGIGTTSPGEKLHVSGGNVTLDAGYYYNFRDRSDLGMKEDDYSISIMAPEEVYIQIDSNSNNSDDTFFAVQKDGNTVGGGTELFRVQENGNVGIGTNSPDAKLHVDDGVVRAPQLTFGSVASTIIQCENSEFAFGLDNDSPWSLWIQGRNNSNAARDISLQPLGGKIGIGTEAPGHLLDVDGDGRFGTTGVAGKLYLSADDATSFLGWNASGTDITLAASDDLVLHADDDIFFQAGGTTKMYLLDSGRLGIGTDSPSTPLHVKSTTTSLDNLLLLENDGGSGSPGVGIKMFSNVGTSNYLEILHDAFGATNFKTVNGSSTYDKQMHLQSDGDVSFEAGNVAIGHASPTMALDVKGDVFIGNSDETTTLSGSGDLTITGDTALATFKADNSSSGDQIAGIRVFADSYRSAGMIVGDYDNSDGSMTEDWIFGRQYASTNKAGIFAAPENGGDEYITVNSDSQKAVKIAGDNDDIDFIIHGSSGEYFRAEASTGKVGIGTTSPNQLLTLEGTMSLKEQASANADTAAYGQLWVKTATPNELYFTTDAGDDIQLTSGTSAAGGGGSGAVSAVANGSDNRIATFSSSDALNGEANLTFDGSTLALAGKQTITVNDDVSEAFKVTITDTDSTVDSTPFVIDGDGRVGIGTDTPVDNYALTLNGDGTSYEGLAFQVGGSTKFKMSSDGSSFYHDSSINTGKVTFRVRDSGGNLRPALVVSGADHNVSVGYNGTSGSTHTVNNTLQVNVGDENGVQDKDDGILILNSDLSIAENDIIGGIGFATRDGNIPSSVTEAAVALVAKAREDHSTGDKGGYLDFLYAPTDQDDDTTSRRGMRMLQGKLAVGGQNGDVGDPINSLVVYHSAENWHNGLLILRDDTSISDGDLLGAIGFDGKDGNNPSNILEASAGIAAYAAEDHSTGDKGGDLTFFTSPIDQDDDTTSIERMRLTSEGFFGIGTTSPDAMLHVSSGTDLDCGIIIEADTDNNDEADLPFMWFKQDGDITVHAIQATSNRLQIINNISASGGIDFALGTTNNTGTTDPSTGTTTALSIESDGGVQARKTVIKAVTGNTTLADEDSGKTIYWTAGALTLPATAESGQQFVVINNTGGAATPSLGTSNAIQTGWTAHAAMADETARTYISVAANKWIYIG